MLVFISLLFVGAFANFKELFDVIQHHEIIKVQVDDSDADQVSIKFSAFGLNFDVELQPNHDLVEDRIFYTEGIPAELDESGEMKPLWTPRSKTCHYFATLRGPNGQQIGSGAFSLCGAKRGLFGRISIGKETYFVRPHAFFHDKTKCDHSYSDNMMIYRKSDMAMDVPLGPHDHHKHGHHDHHDHHDDHQQQPQPAALLHQWEENIMSKVAEMAHQTHSDVDGERRRLATYNNAVQLVELKMVVMPEIVLQCVDEAALQDGVNWKDICVGYATDLINNVAEVYLNNGEGSTWPSSIGTIRVVLKAITFVGSYAGSGFEGMEPQSSWWYWNGVENKIYISKLGSASQVIAETLITEDFDNIVFLYGVNTDYAGQAGLRSMCWSSGGRSSSINKFSYGVEGTYETIIHEMGHNFGGNHDDCTYNGATTQCPCAQSSGSTCSITSACSNPSADVMGYGSGPNYFGACSLTSIEYGFANSNSNYGCLSNKNLGSWVAENYYTTVGTLPDPTPYSSVDISACSDKFGSQSGCLQFSGYDDSSYMGIYRVIGCSTGTNGNDPTEPYPYYQLEGGSSNTYIYKTTYSWWGLSATPGQASWYMYCRTSNVGDGTVVSACGNGAWREYSGGWVDTSAVLTEIDCPAAFGDFLGTGNVSPTDKPTAKPTNKPTAKPTSKPTNKPTNKPTTAGTPATTATPTTSTTSSSSSGISCTNDNDGPSCIEFSGISVNTEWNGQWEKAGCSSNGYPYYTKGSLYLYFNTYWMVSSDSSFPLWNSADGLCAWWGDLTNVMTACATSYSILMRTDSGSFSYTTSGSATDCSTDGAFVLDDNTECLDDNEYGEHICVFLNGTVYGHTAWTGHAEFELDGSCSNDQPVWKLVAGEELDLKETYYLTYDDNYIQEVADQDDPRKRWIISSPIDISNPTFQCEAEALTECTRGTWMKAEVGDVSSRALDIVEYHMMIYTDQCSNIVSEYTKSGDNDSSSDDKDEDGADAVVIVVVVLVAVLLILVVAVAVYKCNKSKGKAEFQEAETAEDPYKDVETQQVMMVEPADGNKTVS